MRIKTPDITMMRWSLVMYPMHCWSSFYHCERDKHINSHSKLLATTWSALHPHTVLDFKEILESLWKYLYCENKRSTTLSVRETERLNWYMNCAENVWPNTSDSKTPTLLDPCHTCCGYFLAASYRWLLQVI